MTFEALADVIGAALDTSFSEPAPFYQPKFDTFGSAIDAALAALPTRSVAYFGAVGDGSTNDQTAVQDALNACAGLYTLTIPANFNCVVNGLTVPSDTVLLGPGKLFLAADSNTHVLMLIGNNILIRGVSIDGNKANNDGSGPYFGSGGITTEQSNFPTIAWSNIRIEDCTIVNCFNWPISIYSSDNVSIINNTMKDSGNAPQVANGTQHFVVTGNYSSGIPDFGFATYEGCSYGVVSNNVIDSCACIGCLNDGTLPYDGSYDYWQSLPQHDIIFSGNVVTNSIAYGCIVQNATTYAPADPYNIIVDDNTFENSGISNTGNASGVIIAEAQSVTITNNRIRGGGTADSTWIGITGACFQTVITGNIISNGGNVASGVTAFAIQTVGFTNGLIADNYAFDDQATPTLGYLFGDLAGGVATSGTIIRNNTFKNLLYGLTNAAFPTAASATFEGQTLNANTDTTRTQDLIFVPPGGPTAASLPSSKLTFTSTNAASTPQSGSFSLDVNGNLESSAPLTTTSLNITDPSINSILSLVLSAPADTNGVNFKMIGNGTATPAKTVRVAGGVLEVVNDAYSSTILRLDDSGNLTLYGAITAPSATINGPLNVTDPATTSISNFVLSSPSNTAGANFRMVGNGVTTPTKTIRVIDGLLQVVNDTYSSTILSLDDSGNLALHGALFASDVVVGGQSIGDAWTAVSLTATSAAGTITSYTCNARYRLVGKTCDIQINLGITDNGTASGAINIELPFATPNSGGLYQVMSGRENAFTGNSLNAYVVPNSTNLSITTYNNAYPGGDGYLIYVGGVYEVA